MLAAIRAGSSGRPLLLLRKASRAKAGRTPQPRVRARGPLRHDMLCVRPRCSSQPETELLFLRGLCVDRASRRQGLGTRLANEAVQADAMASSRSVQLVYLFCEPQFLPMYIPAGFEERAPSEVPPAVAAHFGRVAGQQARKNNELRLMVIVQSSAASSSRGGC